MNYLRTARRLAVATLFAVCFLVGVAPWLLYWVGLHGAGGTPVPPLALASSEAQLAAWQRARGIGPPTVTPLNPYTVWGTVFSSGQRQVGAVVAWQVASSYIVKHQRYAGNTWWHLSGAALTIWLTRNWSIEQLLTQAAESRAG